MKTLPFVGRVPPGGHLALGEGEAEVGVGVDAHDLAGALHFGAEDDVHAGEFAEGEDGLLDAVVRGDDFLGEAEFFECFAGHDLGGELGQRDADGLGSSKGAKGGCDCGKRRHGVQCRG